MALATYGYALTALLHAALAVRLVRDARQLRVADTASMAFVGAVGATALWGASAAAASLRLGFAMGIAASVFDAMRYGLWFTCLLSLLRPVSEGASTKNWWMAAIATSLVALMLLFSFFAASASGNLPTRPVYALAVALPSFGLFLVEQLYRNRNEHARWGSKPFCVGLGLLFAFDIYLYSEAALFGHISGDAASIRGAVHAACVPLLLIAQQREAALMRSLRLSRTAAFQTATLLVVGAYLLFVSGVGYYVREFGGDWGSALQIALLFVGGTVLIGLLLSGSARSLLRVYISKHFFRYRYDYRNEWLRFTSMLSSAGGPHEVSVRMVRGLADMVESTGGALWSKRLGSSDFVQIACWNMARSNAKESAGSPLADFMRTRNWIIDIDECRSRPHRYGGLEAPAWLGSLRAPWLIVPLPADQDLIGFVVLAQPRTPVQVNWEVRDLLKTAARQAAGFLAQMNATEALLEARKFEAFNKMSAFVVHDLKNIVTQLALMVKNAKRLHANPEFQQDMLATVENTLDKMRQLILQLREGQAPAGGESGVDLGSILAKLRAIADERGRAVDLELIDKVATRGHEDRIERVIGHVLQNAIDATSPHDKVWLRLQRSSGQAQIIVGDNGPGMSQEFIHTQLFKPFHTTKQGGMGIGAYESYQYVKELGGSLEVDSEVGRGTIVTIRLPLFEAQKSSDLPLVNAK